MAPPLLGLLMEVVGARGALVAGGLIIAVAIGAGALLRSRERISWLVPAPAPAMAADYRSVA
ncbi:MFS transporter OS=Streptomyces rimosus subsp. rimosus (strain ATCC / DSM 40260 / JCM 4667 / NRRL 2234) OX=1265868 GN=SRIM_032280 PE=4 SV=1 [Streptomyces rimosus subsp. rimosus]